MDWITSLEKTINYIEENLTENITLEEAAGQTDIDSVYLQKGFSLITGFSLGEYLRNRRLYCAALDILNNPQSQIIDIALKYCYETHESFTKAFYRFHGINPSALRKNPEMIKVFNSIKLNLKLNGGYQNSSLEWTKTRLNKFTIAGYVKEFNWENFRTEVPEFWEQVFRKHYEASEIPDSLNYFRLGELCATISSNETTFKYIVGGLYKGGKLSEGMTLVEVPECTWLKFPAKGRLPEVIQSLNTEIFQKWLPEHPEIELANSLSIEWYDPLNTDFHSPDFRTEAWIPVKE